MNIITTVETCLKANVELEVLNVFEFNDDIEIVKDEIINSTISEYKKLLNDYVSQISTYFKTKILPIKELYIDSLPLCGAIDARFLQLKDRIFYIAISHEDRECPVILSAGVLDIKSPDDII